MLYDHLFGRKLSVRSCSFFSLELLVWWKIGSFDQGEEWGGPEDAGSTKILVEEWNRQENTSIVWASARSEYSKSLTEWMDTLGTQIYSYQYVHHGGQRSVEAAREYRVSIDHKDE